MTDLLALTATLVDHRSESFAEGPFVDWLEAKLRALPHLDVERIGDNLVARTDLGRDQRLMLVGHTDTVPAVEAADLVGGTNAIARIEGDTLWGVGSTDMKGGLACFLEIARTVTEPSVDLTFVFYAREEVAQVHNGLLELFADRPDLLAGDCAILGEPTDGAIEAGCQGTLRFEITFAGARAHTARPWMGRNAVHRMAGALSAVAGYEARRPVIDGCEFVESLQVVHIEGGVAGNVVPDRGMMRIHHRYAPDRTVDEAEAWVRSLLAEHLDPDDTVEVIDRTLGCPPSLEHPLLGRLRDENGLEVRAKLGWTDVARFAEHGIPATNFGSGDPTIAHTKHEHLERASIERTFAALHRLVT